MIPADETMIRVATHTEGADRAATPPDLSGACGDHAAAGRPLSRRFVLLLAAACGLAVANLYYAQPLLATIARSFHAGAGATGLLVTLTQVGYAVGLALLVPLGDVVARHRLVPAVLLCAAVALAAAALVPSLVLLALLGLAIGATSVVAQVLVPFAADLSPERERGRVVGAVMSGVLIGILLARTLAGAVAGLAGWRAVFALAAALMLGLAAVLWWALPRRAPAAPLPYPQLLRSVVALLRAEATLRRRCLYGALNFAAFSAFWTTAAFLLAGPPYRYGATAIGLFGLLGAAGAAMAALAGRLADRGRADGATGAFAGASVVAFALLVVGGRALAALVAGVVLLDLGVQGLLVTNQSVIYRLRPEARSRLTTAYMTSSFAGGAAGSAGAVGVYGSAGWGGVCLLGGLLAAAIVALWALEGRGHRRRAAS